MSGKPGAEAARPRLALAAIVGGVVTLLLPWLVATTMDAPSLVLLTALAAAAVTALHGHAATSAAHAQAPPRSPADGDNALLLAGRVTDTMHHPLRPRAPGLV
jgi:hypothetical protein